MAKRGIKTTVRAGGVTGETVVEFSGSKGQGGLISIHEREDGTITVEVYRQDPEVRVVAGSPKTATERAEDDARAT